MKACCIAVIEIVQICKTQLGRLIAHGITPFHAKMQNREKGPINTSVQNPFEWRVSKVMQGSC